MDIDIDDPAFVALYDELPLWSAPFGLMLLDRVPVAPGLTIVDLGAGTGFLTIELAERCGPTATVIAVDPWAPAVARLQRKAEQRGLANVRTHVADAASLELAAASVDVFVSNLGVNNFDDPDGVVARCAAAGRPGTTFVLTTNLVGHMAELYDVFASVLQDRADPDAVRALEAHIAHRATVASVRALMDRHGFTVTDVHTDSFRWRFADGGALLGHFFIRFGFRPAWEAVVGEGDRPAVMAALEAALDEVAQRDGGLRLTIPMACITAVQR